MLFYVYLNKDGTRVSLYQRGILPVYTMKYLGIIPFKPVNKLVGLKELVRSTLDSILGSQSAKVYRINIYTTNLVGIK